MEIPKQRKHRITCCILIRMTKKSTSLLNGFELFNANTKPYFTVVCNWLILQFYFSKQNVKQIILNIFFFFLLCLFSSGHDLGITCHVIYAVYKVQGKVVFDKTFFENTLLFD